MTRRWPDFRKPVDPPPFARYFFGAVMGVGILLVVMKAAFGASMKASTYDEDEFVATGARYDPNGVTAAHRTLPFGTKLTVRYGHSTVVLTINDRGPAPWTGRDIDLSAGAARALRFPGTGKVVVESWPPLPKPRPGK